MATSFQEILDWLDMPFATGHTHVHGLVSVEERENLQHQQSPPAVIRALVDAERYHASHVYFRAFPDSEKPPQAQAFLYDCTDKLYHEAELAKIHLKLWNYGKVALVYVIYSDRVDIFSCLQPPTLHQDQPRYQPAEQLVLDLQVFSG